MKIDIYKNLNDEECVFWEDEQGAHSMLKSVYDEMIAKQEANQKDA